MYRKRISKKNGTIIFQGKKNTPLFIAGRNPVMHCGKAR